MSASGGRKRTADQLDADADDNEDAIVIDGDKEDEAVDEEKPVAELKKAKTTVDEDEEDEAEAKEADEDVVVVEEHKEEEEEEEEELTAMAKVAAAKSKKPPPRKRWYTGGRWKQGKPGRPPKRPYTDDDDDGNDEEDEAEQDEEGNNNNNNNNNNDDDEDDEDDENGDDEDEDEDNPDEDDNDEDNDVGDGGAGGDDEVIYVDDGLVPVRLDIEVGERRLQEMLLVRRGDTSAQRVAELLVSDLDFPQVFEEPVRREILAQIDRCPRMQYQPDAGELRRAITVDIRIGIVRITDRVDWDLNRRMDSYSPEDFARQFAAEMHLAAEFIPIVAFSLREQIMLHIQALLDGRGATGVELPPIRAHASRQVADIDDWTPAITVLSSDELERLDKERMRSDRVMRREARRQMY